MTSIYLPSRGAGDWQLLLADPVKHWRTGYSARTLAHCWEAAAGLPPEIKRLFGERAELLIAIPEHKVPLPRGRESQSDLFALISVGRETVAATIEGKVNESFDKLVSEWLVDASDGKLERPDYLCTMLGLNSATVGHLRYQLLHRTASAIIEARRFKTDRAAMVVHSFSPTRLWFGDFAQFVAAIGGKAEPDVPCAVQLSDGMRLMLGWASGDERFLQV
ncbi:DUF6946 family protein [Devosia submarina]|uniref:DUF6946 family protein n=1 Tax=Devosia submarina TaxID=1173082 RepID=UPI000D3BFB5C|nr:hypothetical protein [Devosia submarina]